MIPIQMQTYESYWRMIDPEFEQTMANLYVARFPRLPRPRQHRRGKAEIPAESYHNMFDHCRIITTPIFQAQCNNEVTA